MTGEGLAARTAAGGEQTDTRSGTVAEYERRFAARVDAPFAAAFRFARTALAAVLRAHADPGDEVLLSPLTCKVVPLAVLSAGLRPVYVDIHEGTLNLDPGLLPSAASGATRAVLFQRTYGIETGADQAAAEARRRGLLSIEDCAQCMPGASAWVADVAIFSNNPGKPLGAGSGGAAVTRNAALAEVLAAARDALAVAGTLTALRTRIDAWLRNTALSPGLYWPALELARRLDPAYTPRSRVREIDDEIHAVAGRITAGQARAGLAWLERADAVSRHRIECCREYAATLHGRAGTGLINVDAAAPLYYFPVLVDDKPAMLREAKRRRIEIIAWPVSTPIYPVADEAALVKYDYVPGSCPVAERAAGRLVGLPTHRLVNASDRERITELVLRFAGSRDS